MVAHRERKQARVGLPSKETAPNFRNALTQLAGFKVDFEDGSALVLAEELAPPFLRARRLVSRGESRERIWEILAAHPRRDHDHGALFDAAIADAQRMVGMGTPEGLIGGLSLRLLVTSNKDLRPFLEHELDGLFLAFPTSTLWMLIADDRLLSRIALTHILFQLEKTPDLRLGRTEDGEDHRRSLWEHSGTGGVAFGNAVQPIFLAFSPAATGFAFDLHPHALLLEYGAVTDLRRQNPCSLGSLYDVDILKSAVPNRGLPGWSKRVPGQTLGSLLAWWVNRINRLYWIATDPTCFVDASGHHDSSAQLGYLLTLERVLGDMRTLGASPQAAPLVRLNLAFDLLDKLETLMGYGPRSSGDGFALLLDRSKTLPRLERAFSRVMPLTVAPRFSARARELFNEVYEELRLGVLNPRLRDEGVLVGQDELTLMPWDEYVGRLIRSVRNSSHGLLGQLTGRRHVDLAATHTGSMPSGLPDLAFLIALGILSEPERLWEEWASSS